MPIAKFCSVALAVLIVLATLDGALAESGSGNQFVVRPDGGPRAADLNDLRPHIHSKAGYVENWTYSIYLDDDIQLYMNYTILDMGIAGGLSTGADLTVVGVDDPAYFVARKFDIDELTFEDDKQKLTVHKDAWFEGPLPDRHRIYFKTTKNQVSYLVDLEFTEIEPGIVPGDGLYRFSKKKAIGLFIHIPHAKVTGTVTVNDKVFDVTGTAFMDHFFQTKNLLGSMCCGFQYIFHDDDWQVASLFLVPNGKTLEALGYGLSASGGKTALQMPEALNIASYAEAEGVKLAKTLDIAYQSNQMLRIEWNALDASRSVLSEVGGLKPLAKFFLGGEVFYFRGRGKLQDNEKDIRLNYMVVK